MKNKHVNIDYLGPLDFKDAWVYQESLLQKTVALKKSNWENPNDLKSTPNHLLFVEHPHVYTLGKSGHENYLLINEQELAKINASYYKINRGGDITYHGPGQLVVYPILDLDNFFTDVHKYLRHLEDVIILVLADYGLKASRYEGYTGVWLDADNDAKARKICAMGVRCSRWVTMHGLAFNINTDMTYFKYIIPCGIEDKAVTSLQQELNRTIDMKEIQQKFIKYFAQVFNCSFTN